MSVRLTSAVFELDIPAAAKLVLLAMADHAHSDGTNCFPSITTLAKKTGLSRRGTQKLVHKLARAGFLKDTKKISRLGTVIYALTLDRGEPRSRGGANQKTKRGRTGVPKGGEPRSPEPKTLTKDLTAGGGFALPGVDSESTDHRHQTTTDEHAPVSSQQEKYNRRVDEYREKVLSKFKGRATEEFLDAALDVIDQRAYDLGTRIRSAAYFTVCLENFLEDADEVKALADELIAKQTRRERFMPGFDAKNYSDKPDPELTKRIEDARKVAP
jgi:hypothetical protein